MARDIQPLTRDDLEELSQFLTAGFHAPPEADFAAPEVLRWKYLEPLDPISAGAGNHHNDGGEQTRERDADASSHAPRRYIARNQPESRGCHLRLPPPH